jgi:V8-like Glu-specific endopeptidase
MRHLLSRLVDRAERSMPVPTRHRPLTRKPSVEALEERQLMTATPVADTSKFPYSAVVNIAAFYRTPGGGAEVHRGTGALVGPHDVLTTAHTVDAPGLPAPFEVLVFPGRNGPYDRPFGVANVVATHINPNYNPNDPGDWDLSHEWDLAILDLDRNIGAPQFANWLAFGWEDDSLLDDATNTALPFQVPEYPGNLGVGNADGVHMFEDTGPITFDHSQPNWLLYYTSQIQTSQGSSGAPFIDNSPAWAYPTILGVQEAGFNLADGTGAGRAVRITQDKYNWLLGARNSDPAPVDRPQLEDLDRWFNSSVSTFSVNAPKPNAALQIKAGVWNGGTAAAGTFKVSFYLSPTPQINTASISLGNPVTVRGLGPLKSTNVIWNGRVPKTIPNGLYYVGWLIDSSNQVAGFQVDPNANTGQPSKTGWARNARLPIDN